MNEGAEKGILKAALVLLRPHLSLDRNSPMPRELEPPSLGEVISIRRVGGLHHQILACCMIANIRLLGRFAAAGLRVMGKQPESCVFLTFFAAILSVVTQLHVWPVGRCHCRMEFLGRTGVSRAANPLHLRNRNLWSRQMGPPQRPLEPLVRPSSSS